MKDLLRSLGQFIEDPSKGLPEDVFLFVSSIVPMINVDLLIKNERGEILLTWRKDPFYHGWHVPGGIIRFKERAAERIYAVAESELGTRVSFRPEPIAVNERINDSRDIRGHFISLLYDCALLGPPDEARRHSGGAPRNGQWAWHATCPEDLLPVQEMYRKFF